MQQMPDRLVLGAHGDQSRMALPLRPNDRERLDERANVRQKVVRRVFRYIPE